jgi:hypothetical protein
VSDELEVSRDALHLLLVRFGGNKVINPIRRTSESPDGVWYEERYPVQRTETIIDAPETDECPRPWFMSPCSCVGDGMPIDLEAWKAAVIDGRPMPTVANVEMRRYCHPVQWKSRSRDADGKYIHFDAKGRRLINGEITVWAGQCPGCGTIYWQEYVLGNHPKMDEGDPRRWPS